MGEHEEYGGRGEASEEGEIGREEVRKAKAMVETAKAAVVLSPSSPAHGASARAEGGGLDNFAQNLEEELFGPEARRLLAAHEEAIAAATETFIEAFFAGVVGTMKRSAEIFAALPEPDRIGHRQKLKEHLLRLASPRTPPAEFAAAAARTGWVHALIGLPPDEFVLIIGLYAHFIRVSLERDGLEAAVLHTLMHILEWRLVLELRIELKAAYDTLEGTFGILVSPLPVGLSGPELVQAELERLAAYPSTPAALLFLPDGEDRLGVAFAAGSHLPSRLRKERVPLTPDGAGGGKGLPLLVEAWFSGEIETVDSSARDPHFVCHIDAAALGWRSAAALPLARRGRTEAVLLLVGAFPHQFGAPTARMWLRLLQARWLRIGAGVLGRQSRFGAEEVRRLRESLYRGGLAMFVQPVCDLATLRPVKVEALARLTAPEGTFLPPARFLAALGEQDHHSLFRQGLAQGLAALRAWEERGLRLDLSVNITPATLIHPDCAAWIGEALTAAGLTPERLTLELLEQEAADDLATDAAMRSLAERGIRFAIDDLGSGHSSLKRLLSLPIRVVKIDQSLLRELLTRPRSGIRLLGTLIQMAREIVPEVVTEGIETEAELEVVRLLGCPLGQGYILARPMPLAAFPAWADCPPPPSGGSGVRTWLGALAFHGRVAHSRGLRIPIGPLPRCPLTRFFEAAGVRDPVALRAHETLHTAQGAAAEAAAESLLEWITARIEALGPREAARVYDIPPDTPGEMWDI